MATIAAADGIEYTNAFSTTPALKLTPAEQHGNLRRAYGSYLIATGDEIGTSGLLNMFKLPKGATIVSAYTSAPASGATGTYDVGWDGGTDGLETADPNGIFAAVDPGNAAAVRQVMLSTVPGYNRKLADEVIVQIDVSQVTADAGGDTWELEVWYVTD